MSKRCKNCQHWDVPAINNGWGECILAESVNAKETYEHSLAVAYDAESYSAGLCTHSDFGCVQWTRKEKTNG